MSESLSWMQTGDTLALSGELDQDVLLPLWRSDILAQILHPEALEVLESASAEFEPEKAELVPMPTPQTEEFRCYHVPDEFMKVYILRVRRLRKKVATCGVRSCAVSHSP